MRYQYCPNNPERYATNLRRDKGAGNLKWNSARGQDVLLVQVPFGWNAEEIIGELCQAMEEENPPANRYVEALPGVWVRFVTAAENARMNGCPIHTEASTYYIFSCFVERDVCSIYAPPQNQAMISASYNVPMKIHVDVQMQTQMRRTAIFHREEVFTGYYILTFPRDLAGSYRDGDLCCKVENMELPVTRQMLEQGVVYIKTEQKPDIYSRNKGLELI